MNNFLRRVSFQRSRNQCRRPSKERGRYFFSCNDQINHLLSCFYFFALIFESKFHLRQMLDFANRSLQHYSLGNVTPTTYTEHSKRGYKFTFSSWKTAIIDRLFAKSQAPKDLNDARFFECCKLSPMTKNLHGWITLG